MTKTRYPNEKVRIKEWDVLLEKYGTDEDGDIPIPSTKGHIFFTTKMKEYCGKESGIDVVLSQKDKRHLKTKEEIEDAAADEGVMYILYGIPWYLFTDEMFEDEEDE